MKTKKKDKRKSIDLPEPVIRKLAKMATDNRMRVKNYMEIVLIDHAALNQNPA